MVTSTCTWLCLLETLCIVLRFFRYTRQYPYPKAQWAGYDSEAISCPCSRLWRYWSLISIHPCLVNWLHVLIAVSTTWYPFIPNIDYNTTTSAGTNDICHERSYRAIWKMIIRWREFLLDRRFVAGVQALPGTLLLTYHALADIRVYHGSQGRQQSVMYMSTVAELTESQVQERWITKCQFTSSESSTEKKISDTPYIQMMIVWYTSASR